MPEPDTAAPETYDIAIVGAGIVGAAIAYFSAPHARVLWLEAEPAPGTQSTGRSAALYAPSYGPPQVRALTRASQAFFDAPPAGFATVPLLQPRPSLFVAGEADRAALQALHAQLCGEGIAARLLDGPEAQGLVPVLRPDACVLALVDPGSSDIEVDALLQGYVRGARAAGARLVTDARVRSLRRQDGVWQIDTTSGATARFTASDATGIGTPACAAHADRPTPTRSAAPAFAAAPCTGPAPAGPWRARCIVNAAGAWADGLAALAGAAPLGLQPKRRSAFTFESPAGMATAHWPAVVAADESWYLKPDAGLLLGSPANADPVHPHDVVAEELDIATGIHRIETATTLQIRRPRSTWAGLRSFVADGEPVCGFDPQVPGFFWAAALGGYGIQSSPAFGQLCSAVLRAGPAGPAAVASAETAQALTGAASVAAALVAATAAGVDLAALSPGRPSLA